MKRLYCFLLLCLFTICANAQIAKVCEYEMSLLDKSYPICCNLSEISSKIYVTVESSSEDDSVLMIMDQWALTRFSELSDTASKYLLEWSKIAQLNEVSLFRKKIPSSYQSLSVLFSSDGKWYRDSDATGSWYFNVDDGGLCYLSFELSGISKTVEVAESEGLGLGYSFVRRSLMLNHSMSSIKTKITPGVASIVISGDEEIANLISGIEVALEKRADLNAFDKLFVKLK